MQYEYTNETMVQVRVTMTYTDLKTIQRLINFKDFNGELDWRDKELLEQVEESLRKAAEAMQLHYEYELKYNLNQKDNNDA